MVELIKKGCLYIKNKEFFAVESNPAQEIKSKYGLEVSEDFKSYSSNTMAFKILDAHNKSGNTEKYKIKFDALASHDITYVGIIQTARASGLEQFPVPYVLTNCHNSLCAVGGTINEDDHMFGLSAAKKYGGFFVPTHLAVIHTYMREMMSGTGKMILGSDSHTRYGALGTMAVGEGGPEIAKQLLSKTYDIDRPEIIAVNLTGTIKNGVGPQDVALALIGAVFESGFVKNKILEFVGEGIKGLPVEFRNGIDVMTTETSCLSSIWKTDEEVKQYYKLHGRENAYNELAPEDIAYYDSVINIDLSKVECMIAMPFHPSNVYTIKELNGNLTDIINETEIKGTKLLNNPNLKFELKNKIINNRFKADQGIVAGCAGGTFDNICAVADIIGDKSIGFDEFTMSVYPGSQPINALLSKNSVAINLMRAGIVMRSAFCGPCFGAGDVPANNGFSIRHSTRNFENREGAKPSNNQIASVALMDARSIAATAINGGFLTPASELDVDFKEYEYEFDRDIYINRVYKGYGNPQKETELTFGPNIADWPKISRLSENLLLKVCSVINDDVTTTDELIPSGETSSYRSNPYKLAEFTLSRKDPLYVGRAKEFQAAEKNRIENKSAEEVLSSCEGLKEAVELINKEKGYKVSIENLGFGSVIYANKPGDGSAREQAASCQRVLGGVANIAKEYATKRYRSNLINWGMIPFIYKNSGIPFENGDFIFVPEIRNMIENKKESTSAYIIRNNKVANDIELSVAPLTDDEIKVILAGCLINYYSEKE